MRLGRLRPRASRRHATALASEQRLSDRGYKSGRDDGRSIPTSTKKAKPRARHAKRATIKRKRKHTLSKRRWHAAPATASHRCKWRKRRCRTRSPSDEAYIPPPRENSLMLAYRPEPTAPPTDKHRLDDPAPSLLPDSPTDLVEREDDIPLIVQIAQSLAGARVEHALSIGEKRDTRTRQISYRIVPGDESKRTPDMAELPDVVVRTNASSPTSRRTTPFHRSKPQERSGSTSFTSTARAIWRTALGPAQQLSRPPTLPPTRNPHKAVRL